MKKKSLKNNNIVRGPNWKLKEIIMHQKPETKESFKGQGVGVEKF